MRNISALVSTLIGLAAAAGCNKHTKGAAEPAQVAKAPPALPEAKIVVENAGSGEKVALRYRFRAGDVATAVIEMKMSAAMGSGLPTVSLPLMKATMRITNREVKTSGNLVFDFVLESFDVVPAPADPPQMVALVRKALGDTRGMNGGGELTPRGVALSAEIRLPASTNPQLDSVMESVRQQMSQMSVPLPEEPVGEGATWSATTQSSAGGLRVTNRYRYTLTKIEGTRIEMRFDLAQSAEPQELKSPSIPAGTTIRLVRFSGSGAGTLTIDLTGVVPTLELASKVESKVEVATGGQTQSIDQAITLDVKMYPAQK
jgi:hypothetical protein